jgi:hypothetical protein
MDRIIEKKTWTTKKIALIAGAFAGGFPDLYRTVCQP